MDWEDLGKDIYHGVGNFVDNLTGANTRDAIRDARNAQNQALQNANQVGQEAYSQIGKNLDPYSQLYAGDVQNMRSALQGTGPQMGQFDQGQYNTANYLNPSIAYQQQQAGNQLQASAAAQGGLYSGGAMKALNDRAQNIGQQGYADAFQRMLQDRSFGYTDFINHFKNQQDQYTQGLANRAATLGTSAPAFQSQQDLLGQKAQLQMGMLTGQGANNANAYNAIGQNYQSGNEMMGNLLGKALGLGTSLATGKPTKATGGGD